MNDTQQEHDFGDDSPPTREPLNVFYRLTVAAVGTLIVTVLALAALSAGDPAAPVHRWLARFGGALLAGEVGLCLLFALLAMASDRRRIVERRERETAERVDPLP